MPRDVSEILMIRKPGRAVAKTAHGQPKSAREVALDDQQRFHEHIRLVDAPRRGQKYQQIFSLFSDRIRTEA